VEYNYTNEYFQNKETLVSKNNDYYYFNDVLNLNNENKIIENEGNNYEIRSSTINIKRQTITARISSNVLFMEIPYNEKSFKVKDSLPNFEWEIHENDGKEIGNFKCTKATTFFRGRSYIAYFTYDIPIGLGPWKFKGLPGLILYLESTTGKNKHIWQSSKIVYPFNDFIKDSKHHSDSAISLNKYNVLKEEEQKRDREVSNSRLPNGVRMTGYTVERLGIELKYEWED
jgi:GLPGLI family protein